jgi:superfamily II DNA/RNA helicase
MLDMRSDV